MAFDPDDDRFGPRRSDPSHASAARIYDYVLGGDYHYAVDRAAARHRQRHRRSLHRPGDRPDRRGWVCPAPAGASDRA